MLVLNKLPNIQILNGRSTKEEDDSEVHEEEEYNSNYQNEKTNHLYIGMEQIEEVKNLESNSNYLSDTNTNNIANNNPNNNSASEMNKDNESEKNCTESGCKNTKILNSNSKNVNEFNLSRKESKNQDVQHEESNNPSNEKCLIDLSKIELSSLSIPSPSFSSSFQSLLSSFSSMLLVNKQIISQTNYQSLHFQEINQIEENKPQYENYMYVLYLVNSKFKVIKTVLNDIIPIITSKVPELGSNDILQNLLNELFMSCDVLVNVITYLNPKIKEFSTIYTELLENNQKLHTMLTEMGEKQTSIDKTKDILQKQILEDKKILEKKVAQLDSENKIMTDRLIKKANMIIENNNNSTIESHSIMNTITGGHLSSDNISSHKNNSVITPPIMNNLNHTISANYKQRINTFSMKNSSSSRRSPNKTINNTLVTNNNTNQNTISLSTLKDIINEIYKSKTAYDLKCNENKLPKETMEQHMYTYLNKKYGLKNLIIEWAKNIIAGIKMYSKEDSYVLLFGKIMRNEQEEDARFAIEKINESISDLLLYYIKSKNPLKSVDEINKMFKNKKATELVEEEWKGIIYYIYEIEEAKEIEFKIEAYINKKFNEKKYEIVYNQKSMKNSKNNTITNTISNTITNTSTNFNNNGSQTTTKKLSREERFNLVNQMKMNNNILYKDFIKIVLDYHIRLRDKQLRNFVNLFRKIDKDKNGILNEEEFSELVRSFKVYNEEDVDGSIFKFLSILDPYDNQKITFSECVSLFSLEIIGNEGEQTISLLERICLGPNNTLTIDSRTISNSKDKENANLIFNNKLNSSSENRMNE